MSSEKRGITQVQGPVREGDLSLLRSIYDEHNLRRSLSVRSSRKSGGPSFQKENSIDASGGDRGEKRRRTAKSEGTAGDRGGK